MPVEIKIYHDDAAATLSELAVLASGITAPRPFPVSVTGEAPAQTEPAPAAEEPKKRRGRPPKSEIVESAREALAIATGQADSPAPAISAAPEDRVNPDDAPQDVEEDDIEDIEEPAEGAKLTVDDLRDVAGAIVRKFGNDLAKAQAACSEIFFRLGVESISKCPADKIPAVYAALKEKANG